MRAGIPLDRKLDDMRHPKCAGIVYPADLPIASIVIVQYNEPASPLLRYAGACVGAGSNSTQLDPLHSEPHSAGAAARDCAGRRLFRRRVADQRRHGGVSQAVAEIEAGLLQGCLFSESNVAQVKLDKRSGLMTARTAGCRAATGEVAVFLDSHIEA